MGCVLGGGGSGGWGEALTSNHWISLIRGHPDAVVNCGFTELRLLSLKAWKIFKSQTQIPADFPKKGKEEVKR